jgi:triacylglycerol lipase
MMGLTASMSVRTLAPLLLFAIAVGSASCRSEEGTCESLERQLTQCGLPARTLDCSRIDASERSSLVQRIEDQGCPSLVAGNDGKIDSRVCKLGGWSCPGSPLPAAGDETPKYPLVFVSGIDGSPMFDWHPRIVAALQENARLDAHVIHVLPWATTAERAADLYASLDSIAHQRGWAKTNLVCYAVGGLDCRYLVSPGGLFANDADSRRRATDLVASITTVSTPHRGTHVADAARQALASGEANTFLSALAGEDDAPLALDRGVLDKTLAGLSPSALVDFNVRVVDDEGVYYQSFAGVSRVLGRAKSDADAIAHCGTFYRHEGAEDASNELLWITTPFASTTLGDNGGIVSSPNDGMISVESAKWGDFRGCVPADHYDVIGQINHTTRDVVTGFDPVDFYRWIAADLAARGF